MSDVQVQSSEEGSVFLTRLFSLPIVSSAIDISTQTYQHCKQVIPLANATMSAAENTLGYIVSKSKPLLTILHKPISVADNLGVKALELIETKVPAITLPTEQIVQESKDYLKQLKTRTLGPIMLAVDSRIKVVNAASQNMYGNVYGMLARINATIEQVKPSAMSNLENIVRNNIVLISNRSQMIFLEVRDNAKPQVLLNFVQVYKDQLLGSVGTFLFSIHPLREHIIQLADRFRLQENQ